MRLPGEGFATFAAKKWFHVYKRNEEGKNDKSHALGVMELHFKDRVVGKLEWRQLLPLIRRQSRLLILTKAL